MSKIMNFLSDLETGPNAPEVVYAVIEIPKGSRNKYEYDKKRGVFMLDRVLHTAAYYPGDYGFIPQTHCEDGDPLDVLVLTANPSFPGCVIPVRPIGVIQMNDGGEMDDKILAVPVDDPHQKHIKDSKDMPEYVIQEAAQFYENYKVLEGKKPVKITGWEGKAAAHKVILESIELYKKKPAGK